MVDVILWNIINNTTLSGRYNFLEEILEKEDYILFFYCKEYSKEDLPLTRLGLQSLMQAHKTIWIHNKHIVTKGFTREYLQSRTNQQLFGDDKFAEVCEAVVLQRFDNLSKCELLTPEQFEATMIGYKQYLSSHFSKKVIEQSFDLLTNSKPIKLGTTTFSPNEPLEAIAGMVQYYNSLLINSELFSSISQEHKNQLSFASEEASSLSPSFRWNLGEAGKPILPNPKRGEMVTIIGPPKQGKTTFTHGEITYPAIVQGSNVCVYSGETKISDIYALLITKHIYTLHKFDIDKTLVRDVLILHTKILEKTITPDELDYFNSLDKHRVEIILITLNDFINNKDYGRLRIITPKTNPERFKMVNFCSDIMSDLKSSPINTRYDIVIVDYVNLLEESQTLGIEAFTKQVYKFSKNKVKPFTIVLLNHLQSDDTNRVKKVTNYEQFDSMTLTSHKTRELEKTTDLDIYLLSTSQQVIDGMTTLKVNYSRAINHLDTFGTTIFPMISNFNVADFLFQQGKKKSYLELNPNRKEKTNDNRADSGHLQQ